ncbi:MAG: Rid family detoxifying hydrolase [Chloroflexi bacterium]|nr:Rid family detoxifying hydrolase [Chloroflexota bacterium]
MTEKQTVKTSSAPQPIGPYSQAVVWDGLVFVSGQGPTDPITGQRPDGIEEQTHQVLKNIRAILEASNSSLDLVLKCSCFLRDMNDFAKFNAVYAMYFTGNPPARTTIQAGRLPGDIAVEIDVVAAVRGA